MADYNIYIHAIGNGGATNNNPTIAWGDREDGSAFSPTASKGSGGFSSAQIAKNIIKATNIMQNPDSLIASAVGTVVKAAPIIAAAFAVVSVGVKIVDTCHDYSALQSGDYRSQIQWQNFKQGFSNVFHPFSSTIQHFRTNLEWNIENQKREQQRALFGDSVINSYTNRGV